MKPRKLLAAALIFTHLLIPAQAFANYQNPVVDLSITDYSNRTSASYTLNLKWARPVPSNRMEGGLNVSQSPTEQASGYEVYYRNATRSEQFTVPISDPDLKNNTDDAINAQYELSLKSGALYMFRVLPYHNHTVTNTDGSVTIRPAPIDTGFTESLALYLTDIKLTAKGSGRYMTVTWDNPTLDGREIFTGYRLYHTAGGARAPQIPMTPYIEVSANSPDLTRTRDGRLQYTFYDETLQVGKLYAVKVEPLFNGRLARELQSLNIANREYSLSYRNIREREYRIDDAYINPALHVQTEGQDYVRIHWDSLKTSIQSIDSVEIYSSLAEDMSNKRLIGVLSDDSAADVNFWLTARPDTTTYYQIIINYIDSANKPIGVWSEIAWFDPAYNDFSPYKPTILSVTDNAMKPFVMTVQWQAFIRPPYSQMEQMDANPDYNSQYIDRNLIYDIYVTDDIRNFDNPLFNDKIIASLFAENLGLTPFEADRNAIPSYTAPIREYYSLSDSGEITRQPLKDNTVYYIKITAVRSPGGQVSKPATAARFIRPAGNIDTNPLMTTRPPLRIKTDELGVERVTNKTVAIQWDTEYYEAYNSEDKSWYTVVGVEDGGKLLFGTETESIPDPSKIINLNDSKYLAPNAAGEALIKGDLRDRGADPAEAETLPVRLMDIKDSQYEIHTARYDYIQSQGGYENYLKTLLTAEGEKNWNAIKPEGDPIHPEFTVSLEDMPQKGGLSPNTAYVVYFRPYIVRDGKKNAYFPTYVITTTTDVQPPLDITPTVPILEAVGRTDVSITIRWLYTPELIYELGYSENSTDYPDKGVIIPWETISQTGKVTRENEKTYLNYTIADLFPDTEYHIWIRSAADNVLDPAYSAWSNPISMRTEDILPPAPPQGLSPADEEHVNYYNKANDKMYAPIGETYLILEWMRNQSDIPADDGDIIEIPAPADDSAFLYAPEARGMFMAMFGGLIANKLYYARVKTIFTTTRNTDGVIRKQYAYTIQLADNPGFIDAREITAPLLADLSETDPLYTRRRQSEWSKAIGVYTARSDTEYDGKADPRMYPLPDRDYEIIYDDYTQTLTFRFRMDQKDKNGDHDGRVDQRFISRLIEKKTYVYDVDLTRYFYLPVKRRVLDMPYSILSAFEERRIALKVTADNLSVTFPPGSLRAENFGAGARMFVSMTENDAETPELKYYDSYASRPQRLEIRVRSPEREIKINQAALPINVQMRLLYPLYEYPSHVGAYMASMDTAGWLEREAKPNMEQDALSFDTYETALYAVISSGAPAVAPNQAYGTSDQAVRNAMLYVTSKLRFTDMRVLIPNSAVSSGQFNQLVMAVADNRLNTALNAPLNDSDSAALKKARLFTEKSPVIRQDAIAALVRLYELKTGGPVTAYKDMTQTPFTDIMHAADAYKVPLLKAARLGMLSASNEWNLEHADDSPLYISYRANPTGYLTAGDMFKMTEIVLRAPDVRELGEETS
ncbi:MAG: fibronectin type III domain-containing protein [Clostridiales bacterium]|jgi:hypothetical protein|nr:fibronectin type III domain-containing protein [Clostridiales bacterium]